MLHRLSEAKVRNVKEEGRYSDGGNLYLVVGKSKQWCFIIQRNGKRRELGLGGYPLVSLALARTKAARMRDRLANGLDPKDTTRSKVTFAEAALDVISAKSPGWRGNRTIGNWRNSLLVQAAPLADKLVSEIDTNDVLEVLKPLWMTKPESAGKLRERIETLLDAAAVKGWREGLNPARWKGHLTHLLPKRPTLVRGHHKAVPYLDAPAAFAAIRGVRGISSQVLQYVILTTVREGSAREATWDQITANLWVSPRSKNGIELRIPLSAAAVAVLPSVRINEFVFGRVISNTAVAKVLTAAGVDSTIHGWRSTFRDWAGETTQHQRDVIEMALGHVVGSETERAYRRLDMLEKRRILLEDWASFLLSSQ